MTKIAVRLIANLSPLIRSVGLLALFLAMACAQQNQLPTIMRDYGNARAALEQHLVDQQWIDDDAHSPELLDRYWSLSQQWVATWLDGHPRSSAADVEAAVGALVPDGRQHCVKLSDDVFLVTAPGAIGNVFIVAKKNGRYHVAWSTAQHQQTADAKQGQILAAWRAENARQGRRGPYFASSGGEGPLVGPSLGKLESDSNGRSRFYVEAEYAQGAGQTVGAQTSIWRWNGVTAEPLLTHDYMITLDSSLGPRVEGGYFKVRTKRDFRTFFPSSPGQGRRMDWVVRVTPEAVGDLGEASAVPELDALDELFDRVIHGRSATNMAAPAAIRSARRIVGAARSESTTEDWMKFSTLGMIDSLDSEIAPRAVGGKELICIDLDSVGGVRATFERLNGTFYVADLRFATCPH